MLAACMQNSLYSMVQSLIMAVSMSIVARRLSKRYSDRNIVTISQLTCKLLVLSLALVWSVTLDLFRFSGGH